MYCSKKKVDRIVNFYYFTALPIIRTVLKNQTCNIYKYWSYNRNLRVLMKAVLPKCSDTFTLSKPEGADYAHKSNPALLFRSDQGRDILVEPER